MRRSRLRARKIPANDLTPLLKRAALACFLTTALLGLGTASLFFTTAPAWLSLLVEPLNLIFTPGLLFSMIGEPGHDYSTAHVMHASIVFYLLLTYLLLWDRDRQRARALKQAVRVDRATALSI